MADAVLFRVRFIELIERWLSLFSSWNLIAVLLINYIILKPRETVCVLANSIYIWLSGNILEYIV